MGRKLNLGIFIALGILSFLQFGCTAKDLSLALREYVQPVSFKNFQWGSQFFSRFGGSGASWEYVSSVVQGADGSVYLSGITYGSLAATIDGGGKFDLFIAKVNSAGETVWIRQLGADSGVPGGTTSGYDSCAALVLDNVGGLYCAGSTESSIGEANSNVRYDLLLIKLEADTGNILWYKQWGAVTQAPAGPTTLNEWFSDMQFADNKLYFCASSSSAFVEAGSIYDVVAGRLDLDGNVEWIKQIGNVSKPVAVNNSGRDYTGAMAIDDSFIYCSGSTNSAFAEPSAGDYDLFFTKFQRSDGALTAYRHFGATTMASLGGSGAGYEESCKKLKIDSDGQLLCIFQTYSNFADASGDSVNGDAAILKLDAGLNPLWVVQFGGSTLGGGADNSQYELLSDLVFDSDGNIIVSGQTYGSLIEASDGSGDVFFAKLSPAGSILALKQFGTVTMNGLDDNTGSDDCSAMLYIDDKITCFGSTEKSILDTVAGGADIFSFTFEGF